MKFASTSSPLLGDLLLFCLNYLKHSKGSFRFFNKWSVIPAPLNTNIARIDPWSLPHVIQRDCLQWECALRAEILASQSRQNLSVYSLECKNVFITKKYTKLLLSTENLSRNVKTSFNVILASGTSIRLSENTNLNNDKEMLGVILSRTKSFIEVQMQEDRNIDFSSFKGKSFVIQKWGSKSNIGRLKFLMTRGAEWEHLPGYETMLYAYKCIRRIPNVTDIDSNPFPSNYSLRENNFDNSQQRAIEAVLDMNKPLVAVQGAEGTGKSRLLLECIDILARQGKRILLLCNISLTHLYRFLLQYYKLTKRTDFILFNGYDEELLYSCIDDVELRKIFVNKSVRKDITLSNVKEFCERNDWRIACTSGSNSLLDAFVQNKISFDFFLADDAGRINECDSWHYILTSSCRARLFGDFHNLQSPIHSLQAYQLKFNRSLLQQLSEQFGSEVNYYLSTQYRSNSKIREWPNKIFYKHEAPLNDKNVRDICIGDYLNEEKVEENNLVKEPLVLVDTSILSGEWNKQMFITQKFGYSYLNWGNALIAAAHFSKLIECGFKPEMLCYITSNDGQRILIEHILSILLPPSFSINHLLIGKSLDTLIGQEPEIIIKTKTFQLPLHHSSEPHKSDFNLSLWNFEICHAKRQFMAILQYKDLAYNTLPEFNELLKCFKQSGYICGPNDIFKLKFGEFEEIKRKVKEKGFG
uniref:DNA2/NAM7 helicase-like C-terminal domain-containing protein n=1 Tax=Meloidogyne incognita TaxID=6306 RepID=A0A914LJ61_MELIC